MEYQLFDKVFLRTPFFSYARYDLQRLPEVLRFPVFQNALKLASPVLYAELEKKGFAFERLTEREQRSLAKYYNRMCFRPTPFGGFAAFTLLSWSAEGGILLASDNDCRLLLLPENSLRKMPLSDRLIVNPSLYRFGKSWRYYRSRPDKKGHFQFSIDALDAVRLNNELLRRCRAGEGRAALEGWLKETCNCSPAEAADYLSFLLEDEVLFDSGRSSPIGSEQAQSFPLAANLSEGPFYASLERPLQSGGPAAAHKEALTALLEKFSHKTVPLHLPALRQFILDFQERFGLQKVSLLAALDPDTGIAFSGTGVRDAKNQVLPFMKADQAGITEALLDWTPLRQLLFRRWHNGARGAREPLVLSAADLDTLPDTTTARFPNTLAVMFRQTTAGLQVGHAGGASGTQLLGRFSVFSDEVSTFCRELASFEAEANPGVVFADIGQASNKHVDNVNRRHPSYAYEIPLNVYSLLPAARQLRPDDLLLSVQDDQLILESRRLQKRVIPRLTSAYNYQHTHLAVFQLLCELQYQGIASGWFPDLEGLFPGLDYYPRLMFNGIVIAPARWRFRATVWQELNAVNFAAFQERQGLPPMIAVGTGDQQLVFELAVPEDKALLLSTTAGQELVVIEEYLPVQRNVKTGHKPLAAQFVAICGHAGEIYEGLPAGSRKPAGKQRSFPPGSDWLYVKLYCTPASADRLLSEVVRPVLSRLATRIQTFFFIRYADPDHHLRLRFRLRVADTGTLLAALQQQLKRCQLTGAARAFQTDTYHREIERYGGRWINRVEEIFEAGSQLVLRRGGGYRPDQLLPEALELTRQMIACFHAQAAGQLPFASRMSHRFQQEIEDTKTLRRGLDDQYRDFQNSELREPLMPDNGLLLDRLKALSQAMESTGSPAREAMLADLIHMQLNRHFPQEQRRWELLVYYFLEKRLRSELVRLERSKPPADQ